MATPQVTPDAPIAVPSQDPGRMPPDRDFWVTVYERDANLDPVVPFWQDLQEHALEPNAFYEPWMLRPALGAFGGSQHKLAFVFRRRPNRPKGPPELIGFFPLELKSRYRGFPARTLRLWEHVHCFLCTPLIRRQSAQDCLRTLLLWARSAATLVELNFVHGGGPFAQQLIDYVNDQRPVVYLDEQFTRAFLEPGQSRIRHVGDILSPGRRGELRRQRKKLGELGQLESRVLHARADLEPWIEQFLMLEASGWKGQEGTAIGANPTERQYFRTITRQAHAIGKLVMLGLFLDNRPIALKCSFRTGNGSFAFKITYDENFAKYSPGVLLELDNIAYMEQNPNIEWMDSCAKPRHFMIDRLWNERRTIQSLVLSTGRRHGDLLLGLLPLLRSIRRSISRIRETTTVKPALDRTGP